MLTLLYLLFSRRDAKTTTEPIRVVDLLLKAQIDRCIQSPKFCNVPWLGGTDVATAKFTTTTTTISTTATPITTTTSTTTRAPVVVDSLLRAQIDRCIQSPKFCFIPWLGGIDVSASKFTTTTISAISTTAITTKTTTMRAPVVVDLLLKAQIDRCIQSSICNITILN